MDFYRILKLKPSATTTEVYFFNCNDALILESHNFQINTAFRKLALALHPDVTGGDADKMEAFKVVKHAHDVLSNVQKRRDYDASMGFQKIINHPPPSASRGNVRASTYRPTVEDEEFVRRHFNVDEWKAWHYGINAVAVDAVRQVPRTEDEHTEKIKRKMRRQYEKARKQEEEEERKAAEEEGKRRRTGGTPFVHMSDEERVAQAAERLRQRREDRKAQGTSSEKSNSTCCVS